jgi:hypothetical protein
MRTTPKVLVFLNGCALLIVDDVAWMWWNVLMIPNCSDSYNSLLYTWSSTEPCVHYFLVAYAVVVSVVNLKARGLLPSRAACYFRPPR